MCQHSEGNSLVVLRGCVYLSALQDHAIRWHALILKVAKTGVCERILDSYLFSIFELT